jgi:DNA-binding transcriptional regulator YdaS (Cro superfamily)
MTLADWLKASRTTQQELARELHCTQGLVSHWVTGRQQVSPEFVLPLARATGWQLTPHQLRPDLYPNRADALPLSLLMES